MPSSEWSQWGTLVAQHIGEKWKLRAGRSTGKWGWYLCGQGVRHQPGEGGNNLLAPVFLHAAHGRRNQEAAVLTSARQRGRATTVDRTFHFSEGIPDFKSGCLCQSATSIAGFEMTVSTTWEWPAHLLRKFSRAHYYIPGGSQGDFTSLSWSYGPVVQDICCSAPVQIWITHCEDCVQPLGWWGTRPQNWNLHLTLTFLFSNHPLKHLQNSENYFSTKHDH